VSDFQARSSQQGRAFEQIVEQHLSFIEGWTVIGRQVNIDGFVVDLVALDPLGIEHWIECKGADGQSQRKPGLSDGTTAKVTVGVAWYLSRVPDARPYVVWTSHLPTPDTNAWRIIHAAKADGIIRDVRTIGSVAL
jgi:hypothetical protein